MALLTASAISSRAQVTPASQMEKLDRGLVAVPTSSTANFVSWRLLGTDDKAVTTFDLLRNGEVIASGLTKTNFQDNGGSAAAKYQVVTRVNGTEAETSDEVTPWGKKFLTLTLDRPVGGVHAQWRDDDKGSWKQNVAYSYTPNDMSVGDVDGDGKYELFVKWDPSTAQDNSFSHGYTGTVYIDCYKLDGTRLWRIDLGNNIRAGAHYTQFMVYDFDGDGRAELLCKTAPGSKDGQGAYVNQAATDATIKGHDNSKDYRNSGGHVLSGPEYLTVFDGQTGQAVHTTWYLPGRTGTGSKLPSGRDNEEGGADLGKVVDYPTKSFWGDNYGNRSERYLAAVAHVNGADKPACGIFCRGYYTRAYVWAVSFDGTRLHTEWLHCSPNATQWLVYASKWSEGQGGVEIPVDGDVLKRIPIKAAPANTSGATSSDGSGSGSNTLFGNGNHNLSVADVDGDGCDEIVWGAAALNNDGTLLYSTGYGHGDAIHVGKMIPDREGYQVFDVHEDKLVAKFGSWDLHDAATGQIIHHGGSEGKDNGRGMAGDLTGKDGYEFWSSDERNPRNAKTGSVVINKSCSVNFRIYWDGSIQDQLLDGSYNSSSAAANPVIAKWNGSSFGNVVANFNTAEYNYGQTCNTTKATPCLQADILGDWREELVMWNLKNPAEINIYTTWTPTSYAVPTLMHDHVYRMGVCWQNTAYNQPPHLGYYLPDYVNGKIETGISELQHATPADDHWYTLGGQRLSGEPTQKGLYIKNGRKVIIR